MNRRSFITLLGGAAAWPIAARAQQRAMPLVGILSSTAGAGRVGFMAAFQRGLGEGGYVDGRDVALAFRWAGNDYDRLPGLAAELLERRPAVLVYSGAVNGALAAKAATATIPIVFLIGSDPVEFGLVTSLNRPGGNVTGVTLRAAFALFQSTHTDALVILGDPVADRERGSLAEFALRHALPALYFSRGFPQVGGLISYGASTADAHRQAGHYTGRILRGEKPADLPVVQPTTAHPYLAGIS
jgi:ABC-type uncharacterized transport system substrate-binding protein